MVNHATTNSKGIAIIGMAGRFPGARTPQELWKNLVAGEESISFFSEEEVVEAGVPREIAKHPDYVKAWGAMADVEKFDANFFGIPGREAEAMDPQHRHFLEVCASALDDAGYDPQTYKGLIGLISGVGISSYLLRNLIPNAHRMQALGEFQVFLGNDKDFMPTRVSYKLNLRGISHSVSTGCSTTMVATHLACRSLLSYQNDICLAGGANIKLPQNAGYLYKKGEFKSPDGRCRAFDASAMGTVFSNGAVVVVLKRLKDALEDGDHIYAVIKGSALNNDGSSKAGFTAPSVSGQSHVIASAHAVAGFPADTITYMEAHGTGTPLGDPVEIKALNRVFKSQTSKRQYCAMGALKTNLGHLDNVAGVAGLVKTALCLHHKQIPPSLHFENPNPEIDFADSPFFVNTELKDWNPEGIPRRACVSAFGAGGTNGHAVLEEAPYREPSGSSRSWQLLTISAKTATALETMTKNLADHLESHPETNLADAVYSMNIGRTDFVHRRYAVARDLEELIQVLRSAPGEGAIGVRAPEASMTQEAVQELLREIREIRDDQALADALHRLGGAWVSGASIDWPAYYTTERRFRVPLPTYPFEGKRYWVDQPASGIQDQLPKHGVPVDAKHKHMSDWFYLPSWTQAPLTGQAKPSSEGCWIVLADAHGLADGLVQNLKDMGKDVVLVTPGEEFDKPEDNRYIIDPVRDEDYNGMLTELRNLGKVPQAMVHCWSIGQSGDQALDSGFRSLECLIRATGVQDYQHRLQLTVLTSHLHGINDGDPISAHQATLLGPVLVAPLEYPNILCKSVELRLPQGGTWARHTFDQITAECQSAPKDRVVAYRGSRRWVRHFQPVSLEQPQQLPLREGGVYLISGGLGGLGLALARHLAEKFKAKLALVGRSDFPSQDLWSQWAAEGKGDEDTLAKIQTLQQMVAAGGEVMTCQADVADPRAMKEVIAAVEDRWGAISGVIHAAGTSDSAGIQRRQAGMEDPVLRTKMDGTLALWSALENKPLDFMVLYSSMAAVMGGFGQCSYVAANNFLDAFAAAVNTPEKPVAAINWEAWKDVGMASKLQTEKLQKTGLSSQEGVEVFERILASGLSRTLVSTFNFMPRLQRTLDMNTSEEAGQLRKDVTRPTYPRPELSTDLVLPRTDLEKALAAVWQDMLGIETIGVDDDFFELGGDSLKGMNLVNRLESELAATFHIDALFETANIGDLATYLEANYQEEVAQLLGGENRAPASPAANRIRAKDLDDLRRIIPALPAQPHGKVAKNPQAIFILAPPRSGSTLLRVIMTGHPKLFAPPELFLLSFNRFRERKAAFPGKAAYWLEGLTHAVMGMEGGAEQFADSLVLDWENRDLTTQEVYSELQQRMGGQILVDKTPAYAYDPETLQRAEACFHNPIYIHLVRNPYGMIRSYEKAKMDLLLRQFVDHEIPYTSRQMGELVWTLCHQNIQSFLAEVPEERKLLIRYEDLVQQPKTVVDQLCSKIGIDFDPAMLDIYRETTHRMTEGIRPGSKMLGDANFHEHKTIDANLADRWRETFQVDFLGEPTQALAHQLGYELLPEGKESAPAPGITKMERGDASRLLTEMDGMTEEEVAALLNKIEGEEQV